MAVNPGTIGERVHDLLTLRVLCAQYPEGLVDIQRGANNPHLLPTWLHGKCFLHHPYWPRAVATMWDQGDYVIFVRLGYTHGRCNCCDECGGFIGYKATGE